MVPSQSSYYLLTPKLHNSRESLTIATLQKEPATLASRQADGLPLARLAAQTAEAMRGKDTVVLDMTASTPIVDYFVITTATSARQMKSMAAEINAKLKAEGSRRLGVEGEDSTQWLLMDFGDVVLHVFSPEARALYDLENLWAEAPRVDWQPAGSVRAVPVDSDAERI